MASRGKKFPREFSTPFPASVPSCCSLVGLFGGCEQPQKLEKIGDRNAAAKMFYISKVLQEHPSQTVQRLDDASMISVQTHHLFSSQSKRHATPHGFGPLALCNAPRKLMVSASKPDSLLRISCRKPRHFGDKKKECVFTSKKLYTNLIEEDSIRDSFKFDYPTQHEKEPRVRRSQESESLKLVQPYVKQDQKPMAATAMCHPLPFSDTINVCCSKNV